VTTVEWHKSSYCQEGSNCLNVAAAPDGTIRLRESEAPDVIVTTTPDKLNAFIRRVKAGEFDRLFWDDGTSHDHREESTETSRLLTRQTPLLP
jgi:hypothetical protein